MKKVYWVSALFAGVLLLAILALQPRPQPVACPPVAADAPAAAVTDLTLPTTPAATTRFANEFIPHPVVSRPPILLEESEAQRLMEILRSALQSQGDAAWDRLSQNELAQLIQLDPQAAGNLAQSLGPGFVREQMLRQVAHGWADQNPTLALTWASGLADAEDRTSALADVCLQLSPANPAGAITAATQYGLAQQPGLLENLVQQWAAKDPAAALAWADQFPGGQERDRLMTRLAYVQAQISPTDAAILVIHEIPPGSEQDAAALTVLHQWALLDFASALAWANEFEAGPLHDRAQQELDGIKQQRQGLISDN